MTVTAQVALDGLVLEVGRLAGLAVAAATAAATGALVYRWYVREPLPAGLAVVLGVGTVAVYLNTVGLFGQVLDPAAEGSPFAPSAVVRNVTTLGGGVVASPVGRRVGDRLALSLFGVARGAVPDGAFGRLRGRLAGATALELSSEAEIEDLPGYDPVSPATRERLGGRTVALPRGPGSVEERLAAHLRETDGVGRADVDVEDGRVTYLAVGTRPAGIAPTLPPDTVAVPVRADPPNGAGPGDVVQVWTVANPGDDADPGGKPDDGPDTERVLTAELRATAGDVVTVAVDEADADALSADEEYRLVVEPARASVDREFAGLLSAAEERMDAVAVAEGSPLVGTPVGDLDGSVAAVRTVDGSLAAIPPRDRPLAAGETVYLVAAPAALRRLAERARPG